MTSRPPPIDNEPAIGFFTIEVPVATLPALAHHEVPRWARREHTA